MWGSAGFVRIYGHRIHRRTTDTAVAIGCLYRDRREGYRHGGRQAVRNRPHLDVLCSSPFVPGHTRESQLTEITQLILGQTLRLLEDQKRAFRFRIFEPFFKSKGKQERPLAWQDTLFLSGRAFFKLGLGTAYPRRGALVWVAFTEWVAGTYMLIHFLIAVKIRCTSPCRSSPVRVTSGWSAQCQNHRDIRKPPSGEDCC